MTFRLVPPAAALALLLALPSPSFAQNLPALPSAPATWQGFYLGLNAGLAFGSTGASETGLPAGAPPRNMDYNFNHRITGGVFGAQAGYNWQAGSFVYGVETDLALASVGGRARIDGVVVTTFDGAQANPANYMFTKEKVNMLWTLRARLGVTVFSPDLLLFATGGLAFANIQYTGRAHYNFGPTEYIATESVNKFGFAVGAGVEYMLTRNVSAKVEYLYYNVGKYSINAPSSIPNVPWSSRFDYTTYGNLARLGVNYKF